MEDIQTTILSASDQKALSVTAEKSEKLEIPKIMWKLDENLDVKKFTRRVWKNIIVISLVFLLNFLSFRGLSKLQSSLHVQEGMGVICTSIIYIALIISCFIIPKPLIYWIGHKWVITLSLTGYIIWMGANGYAVWATMIPSSVLVGICAAPLWIAQCSYFTELGKMYAKATNKDDTAVIALFFGVFFMFFQAAGIFGNIISYTILRQSPPDNYTGPTDEDVAAHCAMEECPWSNFTTASHEETPANVVWTLCGVYIGIGILGFILSAVFVDNLPTAIQPKRNRDLSVCRETFQFLGSTAKQMKNRKQLFLIPITIYSGLVQTFMSAEWNKSWVTCALGIWMVGLVNIPYAITDAAASFIGGRLNKYSGRIPLFLTALIIDASIQIALATWTVNPGHTGAFYGIPMLWGISDGIWQTQINALYGSIFLDDSEAVFSNYRLWESVGFVIAFGYSYFLCTSVKLYILFAMLWLGIIGYFLAEWDHRKCNKEAASNNAVRNSGKEGIPLTQT